MSINVNDQGNEINEVQSEFQKLNITKNCSYCNKPFTEELWCKKCDPRRRMDWSSGNSDIDKFIKDTIYAGGYQFLEWVPFDRFKDVKQIGEGGFAKVYSATWINHGKVALKRLNGSQSMSDECLNEVYFMLFIYSIFQLFKIN
jgi:hypothetical protein